MARSLSGEATAIEEEQLYQLLAQDVSLQQQYDLMKRMWHAGDKQVRQDMDEEEQKHISRILQLAKAEVIPTEEIPVVQIRSRRRYLYALSGVAAILFLAIAGWMYSSLENETKPDVTKQNLVAENGSRTRTILPDGSTVWLNAGSHISFNKDFSGTTREITLDGEAYFDVVKQPQRPFIVHVAGYDIRVLGTAFNVKSYNTDKTVETTLIRGLVEVTQQGKAKQKPILLHPNEKLIVDKIAANVAEKLPYNNEAAATPPVNEFTITPLIATAKENEIIETAWVFNRLEFRGDSFKELAGKLERWYNIKIVFEDEDVQQLNFNGSFENETAEQALIALKTATPFDFRIKGNEIHIRKFASGK
jgi:ferric-dicitrate binding protein FerR (iron transport regulator)